MHALLNAMSIDMNIPQYQNESDESFAYRLCYSALGQWCLSTALNSTGGISGTTKYNQTIILTELFERYCSLFPSITKKFINVNNQQLNFTVNIRRVYEETGYLLTDSKNHNHIANYGRSIRIGNNYLFFGFPDKILSVNGLGVFTGSTNYLVVMKDFLIRDYLSSEDYFNAQFDPIDFYEKDIDVSEIEFFNPLSNTVPSMSWTKSQKVNCTVARKTDLGPFYRVMELSEGLQFANEPVEQQSDNFTSYEYRRLYFAIKLHYGNPLYATIKRLDELYSKIHISGHLPNREYYLLLLLSWPEYNAFDKVNFIIRNDLISGVIETFENIGIYIK